MSTEHEQLKEENQRLRAENERLTAEVEKWQGRWERLDQSYAKFQTWSKRFREDYQRLTWLSANLDVDESGQPAALLTSRAFQEVLLRVHPCGTEYPHIRAAIDAARKGEQDA